MILKGRKGDWEIVAGLEVHAQMSTKSKLFSRSKNSRGTSEFPNSHIDIFDVAIPGSMPILNMMCIEFAIKTGLALNGKIADTVSFDRKHYIYPDLPAGYQITQYFNPIVRDCYIDLEESAQRKIRINRIHIEQDAGKSLHVGSKTYIDYNRAGVPLMEIVSEPDLSSPDEAIEYLKKLRDVLRYIGVCDCDMEKGSFRCDANVSVRMVGNSEYGTRCEIKNMNSFKHLNIAMIFEAKRQIDILENGEKVIQSTMSFDEKTGETSPMRQKEEATEYCYFIEHDLPEWKLNHDFIESISRSIPELRDAKIRRYEQSGLTLEDARVVTEEPEISKYLDNLLHNSKDLQIKDVIFWITGEMTACLKKYGKDFSNPIVSYNKLGEIIRFVKNKRINANAAKRILDEIFSGGSDDIEYMIKNMNLEMIGNEDLLKEISQVLVNNFKQVEDYRAGKEKLFGFFVGEVMKHTKGKADPQIANDILKDLLKNFEIK